MRTLVGRMVLVTLVALALSGLLSFILFSNERGDSIRRALESALADEIVHSYGRLKETAPDQRAALAASLRGFGIAYAIDDTARVTADTNSVAVHRLTNSLRDRLGSGADVKIRTEVVRIPAHLWRTNRDYRLRVDDVIPSQPREGPDDPIITLTDVKLSIALDQQWINVRFLFPGPDAPPISAIMATLLTVSVVGAGAALVARQIARPLSDLARAAESLGAGESHVAAPVRGPEDVRRASTAFNTMAERLSRQLARQRHMLWALSHDLRTPITALRLRAELIEDEGARQRLLAPLVEIEAMTEQALSLARAGASDEARVNVDLAEIARTLCGELQDMDIPVSAEAPEAVMAECRPNEMARAMRNLAENAAKHGGGGIMRVYQDADKRAIIEVNDEGPGVPSELLAQVAEPFFRVDPARSKIDGAGLGLAIAQAIADSHGGTLSLQNRTPRGFSAKLTLPA